MNSVTSGAVAQRIDVYNTEAQNILTSELQDIVRNTFNNTSTYTPFSGYTMSYNEGYYLGFRNRNTGVGIFYTRNWLIGFYLDADSFRCKYIIQF